MAYSRPYDFKTYEIFIGLAPGFDITGWDGAAWVGDPNASDDWDGVTNTLYKISPESRIIINDLPAGTYYLRKVAVDMQDQRSDPSNEVEFTATAQGGIVYNTPEIPADEPTVAAAINQITVTLPGMQEPGSGDPWSYQDLSHYTIQRREAAADYDSINKVFVVPAVPSWSDWADAPGASQWKTLQYIDQSVVYNCCYEYQYFAVGPSGLLSDTSDTSAAIVPRQNIVNDLHATVTAGLGHVSTRQTVLSGAVDGSNLPACLVDGGGLDVDLVCSTYGADVCSGGSPIASYSEVGFPSSNAFDGNDVTEWSSGSSGYGLIDIGYIGYDFGVGVTKAIRKIAIKSSAGNNCNFSFQYSDDGVSWVTVKNCISTGTGTEIYFVNNYGAHRYWRALSKSAPPGTNNWYVYTFNMMLTTVDAPFVGTIAGGYDNDGNQVDYRWSQPDTIESAWTLPANRQSYLLEERNAETGVISHILAETPYQYGRTFDITKNALLHCEGAAAADEYGNTCAYIGHAAQSSTQKRYGTYSVNLPGTDDCVDITGITNLGMGGWAVQWSVRPDGVAVNQYLGGSKNQYGWRLYLPTADKKLRLYLSSNGASSNDIHNGTTAGVTVFAATTWYDISVTYDGANYRVFSRVAGSAAWTLEITVASASIVYAPLTGLRFGADHTPGNGMAGYIDEIRVTVDAPRIIGACAETEAAWSPDAHWYDVQKDKMQYGAPGAWTDVQRLYVGEAVTHADHIDSITCYAYRGKFESPETATALASLTTFNHNIGISGEMLTAKVFSRSHANRPWAHIQNDTNLSAAQYGSGYAIKGNKTLLVKVLGSGMFISTDVHLGVASAQAVAGFVKCFVSRD